MKKTSGWFAAILLFLFCFSITALIYNRQQIHKENLLSLHTEDVCTQASRRLEVFVDSRLRVISIFATRWATHESRDFSKGRFNEFASILIGRLPGFDNIELLSPELNSVFALTQEKLSNSPRIEHLQQASQKAYLTGDSSVSPPFKDLDGTGSFLAVLPLLRAKEFLGYLAVDFKTSTLIDDCFHHRIRSEFRFSIMDGDSLLYHFNPDGDTNKIEKIAIHSSRSFPVGDRKWKLILSPRKTLLAEIDDLSGLSILILGFVLSFALSVLLFLLLHRIRLVRISRDRAFEEIAERKRIQQSLKSSEERYRSVFNSTSDGFVIFDRAGSIVEANPSACRMHGFEVGKLNGLSIKRLLAPSYRKKLMVSFENCLDGDRVKVESDNIARDGKTFATEIQAAPFQYMGRRFVLATLTDISERKRAENRQRQLSQKVIRAHEEERLRLSRELHDELGQVLSALRLEMDWQKKQVSDSGSGQGAFVRSIELVENAAESLRSICKGLRPPLLDDMGLESSLELLLDEFEEHTGLIVRFEFQISGDTLASNEELSLSLYRIAQESLTNINKHSDARNVEISISENSKRIKVSIKDDGKGFDLFSGESSKGSGLIGMKERAKLIGGILEIESLLGKGTEVTLIVPL